MTKFKVFWGKVWAFISLKIGLYYFWSRLYRWFTKVNNYRIPLLLSSKQLEDALSKFRWRKDPWWQLWDAIEWPSVLAIRKEGDCDEFAAYCIAAAPYLVHDGEKYKAVGILTVMWYDPANDSYGGHNVAYYEHVVDGMKCLHAGNWGIFVFNNFDELLHSIVRWRILLGWRISDSRLYKVKCSVKF